MQKFWISSYGRNNNNPFNSKSTSIKKRERDIIAVTHQWQQILGDMLFFYHTVLDFRMYTDKTERRLSSHYKRVHPRAIAKHCEVLSDHSSLCHSKTLNRTMIRGWKIIGDINSYKTIFFLVTFQLKRAPVRTGSFSGKADYLIM